MNTFQYRCSAFSYKMLILKSLGELLSFKGLWKRIATLLFEGNFHTRLISSRYLQGQPPQLLDPFPDGFQGSTTEHKAVTNCFLSIPSLHIISAWHSNVLPSSCIKTFISLDAIGTELDLVDWEPGPWHSSAWLEVGATVDCISLWWSSIWMEVWVEAAGTCILLSWRRIISIDSLNIGLSDGV